MRQFVWVLKTVSIGRIAEITIPEAFVASLGENYDRSLAFIKNDSAENGFPLPAEHPLRCWLKALNIAEDADHIQEKQEGRKSSGVKKYAFGISILAAVLCPGLWPAGGGSSTSMSASVWATAGVTVKRMWMQEKAVTRMWMHDAALPGDSNTLKELLRSKDVHLAATNGGGMTALHSAVTADKIKNEPTRTNGDG